MRAVDEQARLFRCEGEELLGIIARPHQLATRLGVLVVVGGPQYRVGSHRQFVLLARALADAGVACMRFDYRGMGDSSGAQRDFEAVDADVRAAVDCFHAALPELDGVMLWGLCDGATASAFYARHDPRVRALMLLNPWVKTEAGEAKAYLKHYYLQRLCSWSFWKKLLGGGLAWGASARALGSKIGQARTAAKTASTSGALPDRMLSALQAAALPTRIVLSGRDYVAREFAEVAAAPPWQELLPAENIVHLPAADHTFSSAAWRAEVAGLTVDWVNEIAP